MQQQQAGLINHVILTWCLQAAAVVEHCRHPVHLFHACNLQIYDCDDAPAEISQVTNSAVCGHHVCCCPLRLVSQWHHPGIAPLQMPHMGPLSMGHGAGVYHGEGGAAVGGEEHGGLTETSSVKPSDAIRAEHLICSAELELNQPIGIGAEGKVRRRHGTQVWPVCSTSSRVSCLAELITRGGGSPTACEALLGKMPVYVSPAGLQVHCSESPAHMPEAF